jgi:hypothetical protein
MGKPGSVVVLAVCAVSCAWGQDIVSVRSGLIHHIEGSATLEGQPVRLGNARFPVMASGEVLEVQRGYAEVLLTPGAFLRLDRGASVRLTANALEDTRLELLSGTAMVQVDELTKGNHIAITVGGFQTNVLKNGLYSFDAAAGRVRVFDGRAEVSDGSIPVELTKGRSMLFDPGQKPEKFSTKESKDELYAWSQQRAQRLAYANISASRQLGDNPVRTSFWAWDPWLNTYTFMPRSGFVSNVFGQYYYNPQTVWIVAQPRGYTASPSPNSGSSSGTSSTTGSSASTKSTGSLASGGSSGATGSFPGTRGAGTAASTPTPAPAPSAPASTSSIRRR